MLAHAVADLTRRLREQPQDLENWLELCALKQRLGEVPELESLRPDAQLRDQLWCRVTQDLSRMAAVLPLFGLRLVEGRDQAPGRFWQGHYRLGVADGFFYDRRTAFPLEVERIQDGAPMVLVPEGPIRSMTVDAEGREIVARTTRRVAAFLCDRHPITVAQYARFLESVDRLPPCHWERQQQRPRRPVVFVSAADANAYATWAGGRLLGRLGWEKAARGPAGSPVPWAGERRATRRANLLDAARGEVRPPEGWDDFLEEVGQRPDGASPYGVEGMAGNVREWCGDGVRFEDVWKQRAPLTHVAGSSWASPAEGHLLRIGGEVPAMAAGDLGFRLGRPLSALVRSINRLDLTEGRD